MARFIIDSIPIDEFWFYSFKSVCIAGITVFGVCYVLQIMTSKHGDRMMLICDKCSRIKNYDKTNRCECGGTFINFDEVKWIEDNKRVD
jgi:hypothetical protein